MPVLEISLFISLWWIIGYLGVGAVSAIYAIHYDLSLVRSTSVLDYKLQLAWRVPLAFIIILFIWPYILPVTVIDKKRTKKALEAHRKAINLYD